MRSVLLLVAVAACGGSSGGADATPPDSDPTCGEWTVAPATMEGLRLYDPAPISLGRSIRLAFEIELTACEETGLIAVGVAPGETTGSVTSEVLRQIGGACTGTARTVTRILDFQPRAVGAWMLMAGSATVTFTVDPEPGVTCDPTRTPCEVDCDCDEGAGERCVGVIQGGPTTVCAKPCEVDRDCGGTRCVGDAPGGTPYVCDAQPECGPGRSCPTGFTCASGACMPTFILGQPSRHECTCDSECDPGLRCVQPLDAGEPSRCQAMCQTDGPWCEGLHVCGDASQDLSGLSGTGSVCVFLGE